MPAGWRGYRRTAPHADKERVHVGEFLRLLRELAPEETSFYARGAKEVEAAIAKVKWQAEA